MPAVRLRHRHSKAQAYLKLADVEVVVLVEQRVHVEELAIALLISELSHF